MMKLSAFCIKSFLLVGAVILFSCDYAAASDVEPIRLCDQLRSEILKLDEDLREAELTNSSLSDVVDFGADALVVAVAMQQGFIAKKRPVLLERVKTTQDLERLLKIKAKYESLLEENKKIQPLVAAYHESVASDTTRAEKRELDREAKSKSAHQYLRKAAKEADDAVAQARVEGNISLDRLLEEQKEVLRGKKMFESIESSKSADCAECVLM